MGMYNLLRIVNIINFSYADGYSPPLSVAQRYVIQVPEKKKGKLQQSDSEADGDAQHHSEGDQSYMIKIL